MWFADLDTETISDTGSSTTVLVVTLVLVAFGVGLAAVTAWFWRETAPDPDALGPLSVMSRRRFASLGAIEQRRLMDESRPGFVVAVEPVEEVAEVDDSAEVPGATPAVASDPVNGRADDSSDLDPLDDDPLEDDLFEDDLFEDDLEIPLDEAPVVESPQRFIDPLLGR